MGSTRLKTTLKVAGVVWLAAEVWNRGGRERLLGEPDPEPEFGVGENVRKWVALPRGLMNDGTYVGTPIGKNGQVIGHVGDERWNYSTVCAEVLVAVERAYLGWPINVALAEVDGLTYKALGITQ